MNLMGMVNGLNRMDDTNPFSTTAFLLAVKLIDLFNRLFWADSVAVDLNRMGVMAKCSSKATITRARDELVERGVLVIVRKGKKGTPTTYRMNDISELSSKSEPFPGTNPVPNPEQNPGTNPVPNPEQNPVPINRQDNIQDLTRQNSFDEDDEEEDAFTRACAKARAVIPEAYRQSFGQKINPAELDRMVWVAANRHLEDVCEWAVRQTAQASPKNRLAYFTTLCCDWSNAYIRTKEELDEHQMLEAFIRNPYGGDPAEYATRLLDTIQARKERYTS